MNVFDVVMRLISKRIAPLKLCLICFVTFAPVAHGQPQQDWIQSWVFNGRTEKSARERFETLASQRIEMIRTTCELTDEQVSKLRLAAAGDICRFFHEVEKLRQATAGLSMQNQNEVQKAWAIISPVATRVQSGIFDDKSLLSRMVGGTLSTSQQQAFNRVMDERTQRRYHAIVLTTVASIEESLPLLEVQRTKLVALLDQQELKIKNLASGYETYLGYLKLSKVPEDDLRALLDEEQFATIKRIMDRYAPILQSIR